MSGACKCPLDTHGIKVWDVQVGGKYFITNRNEERTVAFPHPKGKCCSCLDDGSGLKMHCGHYVCPDCLLQYSWDQIKILKHELSCPSCPKIISLDDIIKFGLPNVDEKQFLTTAISVNFCESQDIQQCPSCYSYCQRKKTNSPQVNCTVCTKNTGRNFEFCWYCLKDWKGIDGQNCGNPGCRKNEIEQLRNSPQKQFQDSRGKVVSSPLIRACPKCFTLLQHTDACNEMTCKMCNEKFCFLCLSKASDGSLYCKGRTYTEITCTPAPVQTKLL